MAKGTVVLELKTRPSTLGHVRIDRTVYALRSVESMSVTELQTVMRRVPRLLALIRSADSLDEAQSAEVSGLLDAFTRAVLVAPDDVHDRLQDVQRVQLLGAYLRARAGAAKKARRG